MGSKFSITVLSLLSLAAAASAQLQVPEALLPPVSNQVPAALIAPATNLLTHTLAATNAGAAWEELANSAHRPDPPAQWETQEPSDKEKTDFFMPYILALMDKAKDFYTRFPADSHAIEARKQEYDMASAALSMGATNQQPRLAAVEKLMLADTNLTEDDRFGLRQDDIERSAQTKESQGDAAVFAELEKGVRTLQKEFPKRPEVLQLLLEVASNLDAQKSRGILQELTNNAAASDQVKSSAANELKKLDAVGKPVDLRFTAVDGQEVDISKMKGKVVLIDFWATWCVPCMREFPHVKEAYTQKHAAGLEIIGVSLDHEKANLTEFVASQHVAWPQYFDGQDWDNKFAQQFGIESIPAMWLVDKKGNLRDINAHSDLNGKIDKLLAE